MNHRHTPRSRVEMMLLVNTHHLKSSSQIQRKTWPGDQVPNDTIDQNPAKSLNKTKYPIKTQKIHVPNPFIKQTISQGYLLKLKPNCSYKIKA